MSNNEDTYEEIIYLLQRIDEKFPHGGLKECYHLYEVGLHEDIDSLYRNSYDYIKFLVGIIQDQDRMLVDYENMQTSVESARLEGYDSGFQVGLYQSNNSLPYTS